MLLGLMIVLLLCLNLGGLFSIVWQFGQGEAAAGLRTLLTVVLLNALGFWVLRGLRQDR